jgi:hypothetical protein
MMVRSAIPGTRDLAAIWRIHVETVPYEAVGRLSACGIRRPIVAIAQPGRLAPVGTGWHLVGGWHGSRSICATHVVQRVGGRSRAALRG